MSQTNTTNMPNGVNVPQLMQTIQAIQQDPTLAQFQFRARNRWLGGTHNRAIVKDFYGAGKEDDLRTDPYVMDCDEPPVLTGKDEGANPVEYLLAALSGCVTTTMAVHAASRGIEIDSIEPKLEGDLDVRGFMGLSKDVPTGYQRIRITMKVKTDADAQKLKELAMFSPVYGTITRPTPVEIDIVKV